MRKFLIIFLGVIIILTISACGNTYECYRCKKTTSTAYYDIDGSKDSVLCADCAEDYWAPFDYKNYKVK